MTPKEQDDLVKHLHQFQAKRLHNRSLSAEDEKAAVGIRKTLDHFGRPLSNPALNQFVTLQVVIAPKAKTGKREVRLGTSVGLSNPLIFCIDDLPEVSKKDWENIPKAKDTIAPETHPLAD